MRIAYIFPSRSRPHNFFLTLYNIIDNSESDDYFIWAKLDNDDEEMNTPEIRHRIDTEFPKVTVRWGLSTGKVHSINRDLEDLPPCDIIIIMSDDIIWDEWGFDTVIREAFKRHFPNLDGTVHFPDDHAQERTIIVSMVGINLYKKLGYLYHPSYISIFCDNEFTEVSRLMNRYVFVNKRLFTHAHPIWKLSIWDSLYRKNEDPELYRKDGETFKKRKAINFGL